MVIRLCASSPSAISFSMSFDSKLRHKVRAEDNILTVDGICPSHVEPNYVDSANPVVYKEEDDKKGISFRKIVIVENQGGRIHTDGQSISVKCADNVIIKIRIRTSFNG